MHRGHTTTVSGAGGEYSIMLNDTRNQDSYILVVLTLIVTLTTEKSPPLGPFPFSFPLYTCIRSPHAKGLSLKLDQYMHSSRSGEDDNVELQKLGMVAGFLTDDFLLISQLRDLRLSQPVTE